MRKILNAIGLKCNMISFLTGFYFCIPFVAHAQKNIKRQSPVEIGQDGKLNYQPDSLGNRIVDFSHAGYAGGNEAIPNVAIKILVPVKTGDATARIQAAVDYVGSLPADENGFRGAVFLEKGIHQISGSILMRHSGVVLRGNGAVKDKTMLVGAGLTRETMIKVAGKGDMRKKDQLKIADAYIPVNALEFNVEKTGDLQVGDRITITRPSTKEWIQFLKMEEFGGETGWLGWKPRQHDIVWDRKIIAISGNHITIDAPITTALDQKFGGGFISKYQWPGRIRQVGIENILIESTVDSQNPKDEEHRWMGVTMENVENAWVRQVYFKGLAGSAVAVFESASKVTVEDCKSISPVSEIAGQRRNTFFTRGQQTLFQRCYAEKGYHDFTTGFCAAGPNAFVQCESQLPFGFSGTADGWSSGVLFDNVNVDGNALSFKNRGQDGQGAGWTAANSVMWQCAASKAENFDPPGARNYAFGIWSQFAGDGYWESTNEHIKPNSLYEAQLFERIGNRAKSRSALLPRESEASSSPSIIVAESLTKAASNSPLTLSTWIDEASARNPISVDFSNIKTIDEIGVKSKEPLPLMAPLTIRNGWLVRGEKIVTGDRHEVPWWRGSLRPDDVAQAKPHITRFVPGREGTGFTDKIEQVADTLLSKNAVVLDHNYGLWYDRRRDDHERIRRIDGEVWPPFYEQPFARSGVGEAWDDLSKYDLEKYNTWYWNRLKDFVQVADHKGLVLYHQNYFQHNILEAGAHYADFPWRTANNINTTGFPEPPPYAGDKRIFLAEQFYDINDPGRRKIHRAYIRKCLDNFSDNSGVVQFIGAEYTGPLHFVKFWLDVITEWEAETGKNALVALSTTKDVQEAILQDVRYAKIVDIIDIRYWHLRENGTFYAPEGGKNLAPRQHARLEKTGKISFGSVYEAVLSYKLKYPQKPVIYNAGSYDSEAWAVLMAGGSVSAIPFVSDAFSNSISKMVPVKTEGYRLENPDAGLVTYLQSNSATDIDLTQFKGTCRIQRINPKTGKMMGKEEIVKGGKIAKIASISGYGEGAIVIWVSKK